MSMMDRIVKGMHAPEENHARQVWRASASLQIAVTALCASMLVACGGGTADVGQGDGGSTTTAMSGGDVFHAVTETSTTAANTTSTSSVEWVPAVSDTWQWQLSGRLNTRYAVKMYDIDLFDTPQTTIAALKAQGKRVVCYFSAGSSENWRPDFKNFLARDMGARVDGWAGERWLDTRSANVRSIMQKRLDLAKAKGCDGVEPDNVDAYTNDPGLPLNASTQLDYNRFLAAEAHVRGLKVGLKNDIDQVSQLAADFDFAVNEQCFQYKECAVYSAFTSLGKPVFNAEYAGRYQRNTRGARTTLCQLARAANIRTLVLSEDLDDSLRYSCD